MTPERNTLAIKLATRHYLKQMWRGKYLALPALLLPAIGSVFIFYVPPLLVAKALVKFGHQAHPSLQTFVPFLLLFAGLWALGEMMWRVAIFFLNRFERQGIYELYVSGMDYLFAKDVSFFHDNFAGSITKKVIGYARKYEDFIDVLAFSVAPDFLPLIFVVYILWHFSPWLVLVLVGIMLVTIAIIIPLIRNRQKLVAAREEASNVVAGHVADTIANMDAVRAFARESFEASIHRQQVTDYMTKAKRSWDYQNFHIDSVTSPLYVLTNVIGLAAALLISRNGTISLEIVFVSFSYFAQFTRVMWEFNRIYRNIESAITEAAQFTELLLEQPKIIDSAGAKKVQLEDGNIEFKNVHFRYDNNAEEHLFHNLNLHIKGGEKIALVGHSGGGKTTITKLLLRFMDVDSGAILIDGHDISQIKQADLRQAIAYVPQDPLMFHRSLTDNIRYGRIDASEEKVKRIAKAAHATEFIDKLPQGYATLVGERGIKLSGGQRQRIAIARAMIKDAPILLLDEATSALDSESEKLIQDALWKLMEGRTAIVIAHRLSTVQKMDRILVLENGEIVEQGSHKELLVKNGIYASLWAHQSGGFLEE